MDISVGDRVEMKKQHPCGCKTFEILRVGMDFKIKCEKCGREVMAPRAKIEKNIKKINCDIIISTDAFNRISLCICR